MAQLNDKQILIIEDNPLNINVIVSILRNAGATIRINPLGKNVAIQLKSAPTLPDVILLDLMLGKDTSGYDVFESIQQYPALSEIPVVAVTALNSASEKNRARSMGFRGYITKPINFEKFANQIDTVIGGGQVWRT